MFRTHDENMVGLPGMFGEGQCHWRQVSRILRTHWYHVTVQTKHEGRMYEAVLMVDSEPQLQEILVAQDDEIMITDVQVVTPAYMNGTKGWRMETMTKATVGEDKDECVVCLLEVETGSTYHSSHDPAFQSNLLTHLSPIFQAGMIRAA